MKIHSRIDIGRVRNMNQDAYFAGEIGNGNVFSVVCDGMGGANAGNIASETAVKVISEYVIKAYNRNMDREDIAKLLKNAITSANAEIYDMALKNSALSGMGTTAVAVFVVDGTAIIAHVGDSRAYLVNDSLTQITRDHSVVQTLIEDGKLTPVEARFHPRKNVITRAVGAEEQIIADFNEVTLKDGDSILLCTDGLTNYTDGQDILDIFKSNDIADVADLLVDKANENGGGDNITVVTITK